jgi:hypothetical protein
LFLMGTFAITYDHQYILRRIGFAGVAPANPRR